MIAQTSAKSTLISPGFVMISVTPFTPAHRRLSARTNCSRNVSLLSPAGFIALKILSFGRTIRLSTLLRSFASPSMAFVMRTLPSNSKGVVTTAIVRIPASWASWATTGALPVPVPPPIPAVITTMLASLIMSLSLSVSSFAASSPTFGFPPAPSPPVIFCPIGTRYFAFDLKRACLSVLRTMNSTPLTPSSIIL